ncbi:MAG: hypothetical protein WDW36_007287 [Sanguina aurantia]
MEAHMGQAQCLHQWAECRHDVEESLPDGLATLAGQRQAAEEGVALLRRAVEQYHKVCSQGPVGSSSSGGGGGGGGGDGGTGELPAAAMRGAVASTPVLRSDAAVNAGNALCTWAERCEEEGDAQAAVALYEQAVALYRSAFSQEADALTLGNLADALIQASSALHKAGRTLDAATTAQEGMAAYQAACGLCDSSEGDDLSGLLCNWGAGLAATAGQAQDPGQRMSLLRQSSARLTHAISFARSDPEPHVTLGDTLVAAAELVWDNPSHTAVAACAAQLLSLLGTSSESVVASAAAAVATLAAAAAAVAAAAAGGGRGGVCGGPAEGDGSSMGAQEEAVAESGGVTVAEGVARAVADALLDEALGQRAYGGALTIKRSQAQALVGSGDAHAQLARLCLCSGGSGASHQAGRGGSGRSGEVRAATAHQQRSIDAYSIALRDPPSLGGFRARSEVRYNLACVFLAHDSSTASIDSTSGSPTPTGRGEALFASLLESGGTTAQEMLADVELMQQLQRHPPAPWLQQLLTSTGAAVAACS